VLDKKLNIEYNYKMTDLYLDTEQNTFESKMNYMNFLLYEIRILRERIQPHNTGHIHTTINTLEQRVNEIQREMISERDK
tara:strand:+ start:1078 stop:1317 length:240 start_codon:yes stop_codon:yes gene_type:complete